MYKVLLNGSERQVSRSEFYGIVFNHVSNVRPSGWWDESAVQKRECAEFSGKRETAHMYGNRLTCLRDINNTCAGIFKRDTDHMTLVCGDFADAVML